MNSRYNCEESRLRPNVIARSEATKQSQNAFLRLLRSLQSLAMTKRACLIFVLFFVLTVFASPLLANVGYEFLLMDTSVRASGLGGAYAGTIAGIDGIHYNPASINSVQNFVVSFENISMFEDVSFKYLSLGMNLFQIPFGISAGILYLEDIPIYEIDENYLKNVAYYDSFITLSAGKEVYGFNLGMNAKVIYRKLDMFYSSAVLFDVGAIKMFNIKYPAFLKNNNKNNLSLGLALKNIGTKASLEKISENVPSEVVLGVQTDIINDAPIHTKLFLDTSKIFLDDFVVKTGLEFSYINVLFIRVGKSFNYDDAITLGLAFNTKFGEKVLSNFSYAVSIKELGNEHKIGVMFGY